MKTIITSAALLLCIQLFASVHPKSEKQLKHHLLEVNDEWQNNLEHDQAYDELISFTDDSYRIQRHLFEVCDLIERRNHEYTQAEQRRRSMLMKQLRAYANERTFPINLHHETRQPYFIDHLNTACAVGFLMLNNGFEKEALQVKEQMNYAYIREIPSHWLQGFVQYSSLTLDELALIQPGYPPSIYWDDDGSDIEGRVNCFYDDGDQFLIGGIFDIDGEETSLAYSDGNGYEAWSSAPEGEILDLERYNGKLYATGVFLGGVFDVAVFENGQWSYSNAVTGKTSEGVDLQIYDDELYIATSASGFAGYDFFVLRWDEQSDQWNDLGRFNDPIHALHVFNNELYVGGEFHYIYVNGNETIVNNVAKRDGNSWVNAGEGLPAAVFCFAEHQGELVASGQLLYGGQIATLGMRLQDGVWVSSEFQGEIIDNGFPPEIHSMIVAEGLLYAGGDYFASSGITFGNDVALLQFDEIEDIQYAWLGPIFTNESGGVHDMLYWNGSLYIGGDFIDSQNGLSGFARTEIVTNIPIPVTDSFNVYPNPVIDNVRVVLGDANSAPINCDIVDLNGRLVKKGIRVPGDGWLNLSDLETGFYVIQLFNDRGERTASSKFLKE